MKLTYEERCPICEGRVIILTLAGGRDICINCHGTGHVWHTVTTRQLVISEEEPGDVAQKR